MWMNTYCYPTTFVNQTPSVNQSVWIMNDMVHAEVKVNILDVSKYSTPEERTAQRRLGSYYVIDVSVSPGETKEFEYDTILSLTAFIGGIPYNCTLNPGGTRRNPQLFSTIIDSGNCTRV